MFLSTPVKFKLVYSLILWIWNFDHKHYEIFSYLADLLLAKESSCYLTPLGFSFCLSVLLLLLVEKMYSLDFFFFLAVVVVLLLEKESSYWLAFLDFFFPGCAALAAAAAAAGEGVFLLSRSLVFFSS
jgi:hypothetical protein